MGNKTSVEKPLTKEAGTNMNKDCKYLSFGRGSGDADAARLIIDHESLDKVCCHKSFTLECWAKGCISLSNRSPPTMMMFAQRAPPPDDGANGALHFGLYNWTELGMRFFFNDLNVDTVENIEEWHHYAFVYNSETHVRKIYFDAKLLAHDISANNAHLHSTGPFWIGNSPWNLNDDFGGFIKDVRIWDNVRTDDEIKRFYNVSWTTKTDYIKVLEDYILLIRNCGIFKKYFNNEYPLEIIELIVKFDGYGKGLIACFPLMTKNKNTDPLIKDEDVYDIIQGITAKMKGNLRWIKDA